MARQHAKSVSKFYADVYESIILWQDKKLDDALRHIQVLWLWLFLANYLLEHNLHGFDSCAYLPIRIDTHSYFCGYEQEGTVKAIHNNFRLFQ